MLPLSRSAAVSAVVGLLFVPLLVDARCRNQSAAANLPTAANPPS